MRSLTAFFVVLVGFMTLGSLAQAQGAKTVSKTDGSTSASATKEEVNQLRSELAAQRRTIEELKALVEQLAEGKTRSTDNGSAQIRPVADPALVQANSRLADASVASAPHLMNAVLVQPIPAPPLPEPEPVVAVQTPSAPKSDIPLSAGWNGEHFFIRSPDGQFSISPYGYLDTDYRAYTGDGPPPDTFLIRRARLGFQGNYGSHFDFALLVEGNTTTGATLRDGYLNVRIKPQIQIQAGQFKTPFGQETGIGATNLDFVERGLQSLLYPSVVTAFRSPGAVLHGDLYGGSIQWWAGAFNGRGGVTNNVTSQPDIVARLRFYPWRKGDNEWLKHLAFGGSFDFARSLGLANDVSFSATLPDAAYTFFPQLRINGSVYRYEGDFTFLKGPLAIRGEYDQLQQQRYGVGSEQAVALGFLTLPGVGAKAWDVSSTYLLTGENRPENGTPRVKHPLFGPTTPGDTGGKGGRGWGAWEVALRYSGIQAKAPGVSYYNFYTPSFVPTYDYHTDEWTFGVNWYPNYWVRYMVNVSLDQLRQPSVLGQVPQTYVVVLQRLQVRF